MIAHAGTIRKKKAAGRCFTPRCMNAAKVQRNFCEKCRSRAWRANNPVRYRYNNLKAHAKARGIEFLLTFEQFADFDARTGYVARCGIEPSSATVDRLESASGYSADNIRVLSHAENSARGAAPAPAASPHDMGMAAC